MGFDEKENRDGRGQRSELILTRCGGFFSKVFLLEKEPAPSSW
jgi:hypothetical protein